jgi:predicted Ser/Thr protein kinase
MANKTPTSQEIINSVDQAVRKDFDANRRILSFDEFIVLVAENPERHTRGSARFITDMMDHFGRTPLKPNDPGHVLGATHRFALFDRPIDGIVTKIIGQEVVQNQIYKSLKTFVKQGFNNKLILLHGPNGSAKTSMIHAIMAGLETYSREAEGAKYQFNWIFPVERYTKGGIGINNSTYSTQRETSQNYAKLSDEDVAARIPCDLHDHPLLIVPAEHRKSFLEKVLGTDRAGKIWEQMPNYLKSGDLCHRCKMISDALLVANGGDFKKVLCHIQVERFYFARRYRQGLVTIEPQMHVDAQYQMLTYNKSVASLPASLQSINLFALTGDLVDGNRGLIEYSDILKRPVDTFKYLLSACETGSVNVGHSIAYLDSVLLGTANEIQLDAFKEFPDFTSFKARIELIRTPYLLSFDQERQIYETQLQQFSSDKHIAPHVTWTIGLWAVLTRLKKPNSINYPPNVSSLVSNLAPLEKAKLYDSGEVPANLSPEDRKVLRANLRKLREEYTNVPYYEGRMGASSREMKTVLFDAAQNPEFSCLSPLSVLRELEELVKRVTEYEFLKQDVKDGFHDANEFIATVRTEYTQKVDLEVRESIGLYDSTQWEEFLKKYVHQISLVLKKEKQKNAITGRMEDPDFSLIDEFEKIVDGPQDANDKEAFRQNVISQVGVWSLDHPKEPVVYAKVFPEFWRKLEKHYYESKKSLLTKMSEALVVYDTDKDDPHSEGGKLARQTVNNMKAQFGYCDKCAKEVITFLMKQRY